MNQRFTTKTTTTTDKPWYVLACDGGYVANIFELFNNSPRRPRIGVTDDLQQASVFPNEVAANDFRKLATEVIGVQGSPTSVRFVKRKDQAGKDWTEVLIAARSRQPA